MPRVPVDRREIIVAFFTGAIMGVISYLLIRHIEAWVRDGADKALRDIGV